VATFEENFVEIIMRAWQGQLDFAQLIDCASQMDSRKLSPLSAVLYQTWLSRTNSPYSYAAYFNLGVTLSNLDDFPNSEAAYRKSISLYPTFVQPRLNLGSLFERMGETEKALAEWRWVADNISADSAEAKPFVVMACNHLGRVLESQKQMEEASAWLTKSLAIDPDQENALHHWVHLRQKQCIWPVYVPLPGITLDAMHKATSALAMLSVSDEPQQQLEAARRFVEK
jgi:predicted O-linked N-acetylglucosamine transferase (SPINDLY family)